MLTESLCYSSQTTIFYNVLKRFQDSLNDNEREDFQFTLLEDLQIVIASIQDKQASEKKMRNLTRLKYFLEAIEEYGKVIEIFVNNLQFVAFIWVCLETIVRYTADLNCEH
jgi:hypothetical protein